MKFKIIIGICCILLLTVINYLSVIEKNEANYKLTKLKYTFYDQHGNKDILNPVYINYEELKVADSIIKKRISKLHLIVVFDSKACPQCVHTEIFYLNPLIQKYKNYITILYQDENDIHLENYNLISNYQKISNKSIFSRKINITKPFAVLIDEEYRILYLHRSEMGVEIKTKLFYEKIDYFFKLLII